jgi:hypothetical protein
MRLDLETQCAAVVRHGGCNNGDTHIYSWCSRLRLTLQFGRNGLSKNTQNPDMKPM